MKCASCKSAPEADNNVPSIDDKGDLSQRVHMYGYADIHDKFSNATAARGSVRCCSISRDFGFRSLQVK